METETLDRLEKLNIEARLRRKNNCTITVTRKVLKDFRIRFPYVNLSAWIEGKMKKALQTEELELG